MNGRKKKYLKKLVAIRAGGRCEYCRVLEYISNYEFHLEHIIGLQHGVQNYPSPPLRTSPGLTPYISLNFRVK
jgi:hypothetical protein